MAFDNNLVISEGGERVESPYCWSLGTYSHSSECVRMFCVHLQKWLLAEYVIVCGASSVNEEYA